MFKKTLLLHLLLASLGVAFAGWSNGVVDEVDEFTGDRKCFHVVYNSISTSNGLALFVFDGEVSATVIREYAHADWTFNSFLESNPLVYLKFGDEDVSELVPDFVDVSSQYDYETASFELGFDWLFSRLRTHHGDIRVRFQGEHGRNDFTIEAGVLDMLREGFWNTCVP